MFETGVGAPVPCRTWKRRGSLEELPEKFWKDVTQRSDVVATASPLEVVTTLVLLSDPRLFPVIIVNVIGAPDVLVKMFIQRAKRSLVGTKTFRETLRPPIVCGAKTYRRPVQAALTGTVASTLAGPFLL